jgi:hypothetical protein
LGGEWIKTKKIIFCSKHSEWLLSTGVSKGHYSGFTTHNNTLHRYLGGNDLFFKPRNIVSQSETFNMPQSDITHNLIFEVFDD